MEIINLLFCKIYDEINTAPNDMVSFRCGIDETPREVRKRIIEMFEFKVKREYSDVFTSRDAITLDAASLQYVIGELQTVMLQLETDKRFGSLSHWEVPSEEVQKASIR